jgi:hypothetical protein
MFKCFLLIFFYLIHSYCITNANDVGQTHYNNTLKLGQREEKETKRREKRRDRRS